HHLSLLQWAGWLSLAPDIQRSARGQTERDLPPQRAPQPPDALAIDLFGLARRVLRRITHRDMPLAKRQARRRLVERARGQPGARPVFQRVGALGGVAQRRVLQEQILIRRDDAIEHLAGEILAYRLGLTRQ